MIKSSFRLFSGVLMKQPYKLSQRCQHHGFKKSRSIRGHLKVIPRSKSKADFQTHYIPISCFQKKGLLFKRFDDVPMSLISPHDEIWLMKI